MSVPAKSLTPELLDLMEHEKSVEQAVTSMLDVAYSFERIRDLKLYRARGFASFEIYCQERWSLSKTHVNRVIAAGQVAQEMTPIGVTPVSESQVRPLTVLPDPDERAEAWNDAVNNADGAQPTAKQVEQAVAKRKPPAQKDHPAAFSNAVLTKIADHLRSENLATRAVVLDPFAGTGRIHELADQLHVKTRGVEIEPKWAAMHADTIEGNALELTNEFPPGTVAAIATSPTFGNRMADTYTDDTVRQTYTAANGEDLHDDNSGSLQWGDEYRAFHEVAWAEAEAVLKAGGVLSLNIKNHIRQGVEQRVTEWHINTLLSLGLVLEAIDIIPTRGLMAGENADKRTLAEFQIKFRKVAA